MMRNILWSVVCIFVASLGQAEDTYREWTNTSGRKISAKLLAVRGDVLSLKMVNGRTYDVPLSTLSEADAEFANSWQKEQEELANRPEPKTEPIMTKAGKVLFHSDLTKLDGGWSMPHGTWNAGESGLSGAERAADDHGAVFKRALNFKTAIIEFDFKLGETKGASLSIDDSADHVCRVTLSERGFQARKDDHDHEGPDVSKPFNRVDMELDKEEWHTVRIEIFGEEMLAEIDEEISLGSDPLLAGMKTKFGFTVGGDAVGFRNLTVWEALPNEDWEKTGARLRRRLEVD